jgi:hypothetical protein
MSENNSEGREQSINNSNTVEEKFLLSFVNDLIKVENTIDENNTIKEITNILEKSLFDPVNGLGQFTSIPIPNQPNNKVAMELMLLTVQLEEISKRLTAIEETLQELRNK